VPVLSSKNIRCDSGSPVFEPTPEEKVCARCCGGGNGRAKIGSDEHPYAKDGILLVFRNVYVEADKEREESKRPAGPM